MAAAKFLMVMLGVASMAAAGLATGAGEPPRAATIALNIPAQPLGTALAEFAEQARLQLIFYSELSEGLNAPSLKGSFTPQLALDRLLANTPLDYEFVDHQSVVIRARPASAARKERKKESDETSRETLASEVVITGTSIRGVAPVGSPVFVYDQEDFDRAGAATPQQFLSTLTQNFGGTRSDDMAPGSSVPGATNDNTYGGSTANLRGLGSGSTLVLVNGHRQALSGAAEYVDISLIPLSAIERIEVLLDGASAIYGSDAVGGVVNFILLKDYRGYRTRLRTGTTTQGGGTDYQVSQAAGFGWDSGNVLLNYEFYKLQPIMDDQRAFTRDIPGNNDFISGQTKNSLLLSAGQNLSGNLHVSLDGLYSKRTGEHLFLALGQALENIDADNTQSSGTASVFWKMNPSWSAKLDIGASENKIDTVSDDIFNDQRSFFQSRYALQYADLQLDGSPFRLPAGLVRLVVGSGYRKEDYEVQTSDGLVVSLRRIGDYSVESAFMELMVPLLNAAVDSTAPRLAVSLAGRYEDYDSFGSRLNPKFGVQWVLSDDLKLRASYGKSFRAPSVQQLDSVAGVYILQNVVTAAGIRRVISKIGNASTLGPETSASWTVGLDFKLGGSEKFNGKITWFDIDYKNRIANIPGGALQALTEPAFASVRVLRSELSDADFNDLVSGALSGQDYRVISGCPPMYRSGFACSEPAANFSAILDRGLRNLAATHDVGVDVNLNRLFQTNRGVFNLGMNATYLFDYKRQITPLSPDIELVDTIYNPIDLRLSTALEWIRGNWNITGTLNYTDGYTNTAISPTVGVSSWTTMDFNIRYELQPSSAGLLRDASLILHVQNVFDVDPPFVTPTTQNQIAYDAANADPYGRQISLTLTKNW